LNLSPEFRRSHREVTQGVSGCEVADEPVVVTKSRPMNAGNRREDKTEVTTSGDLVGLAASKVLHRMRRGEVTIKCYESWANVGVCTQAA
jgi:hypothetical protein